MGILRKSFVASQLGGEKVPPGFKTCRQWAEEEGLATSTVRHQLGELLRAGLWIMRNVRVQSGPRCMMVPHYAPKPKGKAKAKAKSKTKTR